jgi:hypothetical protein
MKKIYFFIAGFFLMLNAYGQSELTLPFMENIFQASYVNPSAMPEHKLSIGLPGMSSVYAGVTNTGFTFRDAFPKMSDGTTSSDFDNMIAKMRKKNYVYTGVNADLFSIRLKVREYYFSYNITEKISFRFAYPKDFFTFIQKGNEAFVGSTADFSTLSINASHYREHAFGMLKETKKIIYGGRVKFLTGFSNIHMKNKKADFSTGSEMYELGFSAEGTLNTAGIPHDSASAEDFGENYLRRLEQLKNPGLALDGGFTYKLNKKWNFSFAFNNIGFIKWKTDVKNYKVKGKYDFAGFDIANAFISDDSLDQIETYADSLEKAVEYSESNNKYSTGLIPHFYFTAKYNIGRKTQAGASLFIEKYKSIRPALTFGLYQEVGKILNLGLTWSIQYGKANNLGLGIMVKPGPFQIYFVGDRIFQTYSVIERSGGNFVAPLNSKMFNFRLGINLVFGRVKLPDAQTSPIK